MMIAYVNHLQELEKQIADTKKMVVDVCQPKFKITDGKLKFYTKPRSISMKILPLFF